MEAISALVVVMALIFFGALISMGNERQRRAIDSLREQVVQWAVQDLQIKKEKLGKEVRIDDPIDWLNKVTTNVVGYTMQMQIVDFFESPVALECTVNGSTQRALFSPLSPGNIRRLKKEQTSRLAQISRKNPLFSLPRRTETYEISVLNSGMTFDMELQKAWQSLARYDIGQINQLWLYLLK
jgi:hypothetical protein